jgi:hypothetical protein
MDKLIELANAGLEISIFGPYTYRDNWVVNGEKKSDGIELKIKAESPDLYSAINDLYERWVKATSKGIPNLGLNQIEHIVPPAPQYSSPAFDIDNEIPF